MNDRRSVQPVPEPDAPVTAAGTDHGLGAYVDQLREDYSVERYDLRRQLCVVLFGIATVLGLVFGLS